MRLLILLSILCGVLYWQSGGSFSFGGGFDGLGAGRHADSDPVQKSNFPATSRKMNGFTLKLHHTFSLKALVLSKRNYISGSESKLSPVDLALGWGPMSNPAPLRSIQISQGGRFYRFRYSNYPPIAHRDIERHSANMHIIPANDNVSSRLKKVRKGDVVVLKGHLVDVKGAGGWYWNSSRTRNDTGAGACELFLVDYITINK